MKIKQLQFQYKGDRDYVQGTDMFNALLQDVNDSGAVLSNIRFTVHDFIHTASCKLFLTEDKSSLDEVKTMAARCQIDVDGKTHWMAIAPDADSDVVPERHTYDEGQIISKCSMEKEGIRLNQMSTFSFIETVVAMNKQMHKQLFPKVEGQWIFARIDLPVFCDSREDLSLVLRHNMNYKLTKSDVEVNGEKVGDIFFSLVSA